MGTREELSALRESVAISRMDHVAHVRLSGDDAYEALDAIVSSDMRVRDGQILHSLLLEETGQVFADIHVACDDEDFFLISEGPTPGELVAYLERHLADFGGLSIHDRSASHAVVMLNGPYAWELLARLAGSDVVGLPYHTFYHFEQGTCFRAGKTGEYGYGIIVARADLPALWAELQRLGAELDVMESGIEALDQCALENFYFNVRHEGREPATPLELQLQWRLSTTKEFLGSAAIARRRAEGVRARLTCLVAGQPLAATDRVTLFDRPVGRILHAGYSHAREDWIALAMIDLAWAHPGIHEFRVERDGEPLAVRSATPPLINNRSLYVSPQIHSYATRHEFQFPCLPRG